MLSQFLNHQFQFKISDGTLEAMKWLALLAMTLDHINTFIFKGTVPLMSDIGRVAFPLFVFAFAYNLNRDGALEKAAMIKLTSKLAIIGLIATPAYYYLTCGISRYGCSVTNLNIMFTLYVAAIAVFLLNSSKNLSFFAFIFMALFAEMFLGYGAVGLILVLIAYATIKATTVKSMSFFVLSAATLYLANGNHYALFALPIIAIAPFVHINIPRIKNVFYYYYAGHLYLIAASILISPIFL